MAESDQTDDRDEDEPRRGPPTQFEIAEYERDVRRLIHFKSAFNAHFKFLDDRLAERERQAKNAGEQ